jgi:ribosomal protein L11 methyltransferase
MDTIKITVSLAPYEAWAADLLKAEMADGGFDSFVDVEDGFEAFIPERLYKREVLTEILDQPHREYAVSWLMSVVPAQNWNEVWEKNYFQPLVIKDQVLVRAPFHTEYPPCPIEIVIEPNMAFGTGNHETTSLMMETMLELDFKGKRVLDMGCGTGILAILAAKLGAAEVTAIDNDPWSVEAVTENRIINSTLNVTPILGDGDFLTGHGVSNSVSSSGYGVSNSVTSSGHGVYNSVLFFDIILVNIQRNVILDDMDKYAGVLKQGGLILFSGFFEKDLPAIVEKAADYAIGLSSFTTRNNWVVAVMGKK